MQRFISPAINALARTPGIADAEALYKRVTVRVREGIGVSAVPESTAMIVSLKDSDIILLSSTRYAADKLVYFVGTYGWEYLLQVPSPSEEAFVQFLFRRS